MKHDDQWSDSRLRELAVRQLADYDRVQPGTMFAESLTPGVADAYRLQTAVAELRIARGERTIGYKVGCTSPAIRKQLGIDHSISGRLFATECHPDASRLSRQQFENLAIEGELAVELSRAPLPDDFATDGIPVCVSRIFPVIELHNHVIRGDVPSAGELIANNAIHAGFVLGQGVLPKQVSLVEDQLSLQILANDASKPGHLGLINTGCEGLQLIHTIRSSLQWLQAHTNRIGVQLKSGDIVLTGSIPELIPIRVDCQIQVMTKQFGSVDVEFHSDDDR